MGWLLPTITTLTTKLEKSRPSLRVCKPLVDALLEGLRKRFESMMSEPELIAAAILVPRFKTSRTSIDTVQLGKENVCLFFFRLFVCLFVCLFFFSKTFTSNNDSMQLFTYRVIITKICVCCDSVFLIKALVTLRNICQNTMKVFGLLIPHQPLLMKMTSSPMSSRRIPMR